MTSFKTLDDLEDVRGQRALVRVDLNVPVDGWRVTDTTRLERAVPTIKALTDLGAKVLLLAHFGRPKGVRDEDLSLERVKGPLGRLLGHEVLFFPHTVGADAERLISGMENGEVAILENTRFHAGETKNSDHLADAIAGLGDFYVNDAFSVSHRAHVSTEGLARRLPAYAGRALEAELRALEGALGSPEHPVAAIVGGAKVSTKIAVLENLAAKVDHLIIGGGMANTFLAARGVDVGNSLCENDLIDVAQRIFDAADAANCTIHLPYDVVVAEEFAANVATRTVNVHEVLADDMILDIGPAAVEALADVLKTCKTLVWNGPLGAFEMPPFDAATVALAKTAAALTAEGSLTSVAGGGDTVAALNHAGAAGDFSFISTAGGAFLEWMEGKELPGIAALSA